jgi:trimeric autotransporter adhesin
MVVSVFGQKPPTPIASDKYDSFMQLLQNKPFSKLLTGPTYEQPEIGDWQKRIEFEKLKTMDPSTGEIPVDGIEKANEFVKISLKKSKSERKAAGIPNVKWKELGPTNVGGRTRGAMYDPNDSTRSKVWSGGVSGGLWYNENIRDANSNWNKIDDFMENLSISCLAYDPSNLKVFYAGSGEIAGSVISGTGSIWKTEDAGKTWKKLPNKPSNSSYTYRIVVNKAGDVFVATGAGIQLSTDGGNSWITVLSTTPSGVTDLEMASDQIMYASTSGGKIFRSSDATGKQWIDITPSDNTIGARTELGLALSTKGEQQIVYAYSVLNWFKKSSDGGKTWIDITIPKDGSGAHFVGNQGWYDLAITVHPTNSDIVYANGTGMSRTIDGGKTWDAFGYWFIHPDHHGIVFNDKNPNEVLFNCDGGVYYSTDGGKSMIDRPKVDVRNKGYNVTQFYSLAIRNIQNDQSLIGGTQDNGTWKNNTDIAENGLQVGGGDGGYAFIDQDDPDMVIGSYQNGQFYGMDRNGKNFRNFITSNEGSFINPAEYNSVTNVLFANYNSNTKIRRVKVSSTSSFNDFLELDTNLGAAPSALKISSNNILHVGTYGGKVFKITNVDNAVGITKDIGAKRMPTGYINCIEIGADENELLVVYSGYGLSSVWYTNDGGKNWANKDSTNHGLPNIPVKWAVFNPNNRKQVMLATDMGVWSTDDITATNPAWEVSNSGLANVRCDMIKCRASDGFVAVGTHGRGLFTSFAFAPQPSLSKLSVAIPTEKRKVCGGEKFSVPFTASNLVANEDYTVYLSDDKGNFSTEQLIGKGTQSPIVCTIPTLAINISNLASSTNFRVKIVANKSGLISEASENITITIPKSQILGTVNNICAGFSTIIQSTDVKSTYTYQWKRSGVIMPNNNTDKLTVNQAGLYTLDVTDNGCLASSNSININVGSLDSPFISVPQTNTCEGLKIDATSADKPDYTIQWLKDGAIIAGATKRDLEIKTSGKYTLSYQQGTCKSTSSPIVMTIGKNISVNIVSAYRPDEVFCKDATRAIYFNQSTTNDMSFQWQKDGKDIPDATNYLVNATKNGDYSLRLTLGKCVATSSPIRMNFVDTLKASISSEFNITTMCKGGRVTLVSSYQPLYNTSYSWKRNGVTVGSSSYYKFDVTEAGDYSVGIEQGSCKAVSPTIKILIDTTNNLSLKLRSAWAKEACLGQSSNYIELAKSNYYPSDVKYTWNKDGKPINNTNNWYYLASETGNYTVTAQKDGCTGTSDPYVYKVSTILSSPILTIQNNTTYIPVEKAITFCDGQLVQLAARFDLSYNYATFLGTYQWQKDGVNIPNATSDSYQIFEPGNYNLMIKSGSCTANSDIVKVNYTVVPKEITPSISKEICEKTSTILQAVSTDKDLIYQWKKDDAIITNSITNSITVNQEGAYQLVVNRGLCSSISDKVNIKINLFPKPEITTTADLSKLCLGDNLVLTGNKEDGIVYQWKKDSLNIDKANTQMLAVSQSGRYSLVTSRNNCSTTSSSVNVLFNEKPVATISSGSSESTTEKSLKIDLTSIAPWVLKLSDDKEYTTNVSPFTINKSLPDTNVYTIKSVSNRCGTGTGKGSVKFRIAAIDNELTELNEPVLLASSPNPFHENCVIKYGLPKATNVKLILYDNQGREKGILVDEKKVAGWHTQNLTSKSLTVGSYILRLEVNGQVLSQKIMLVTE